MSEILVRVTRGGETESVHRVHAIVVQPGFGQEFRFGDPELQTYWRSAMKPFQTLPWIEDGVFGAFGFGSEEAALACASHHGSPEHVGRVAAMLERLGLSEADLACGPHPPLDEEAAAAVLKRGGAFTRLHNNCSGKHAAMLAAARFHGWPLEGYEEMGHPVQGRIREALLGYVDRPVGSGTWSQDGCGVPTPYLSLSEMARAYAALGRAAAEGKPGAVAVVHAMTAHPMLVGGRAAVSSRLMEGTGGTLVAKEGAEGVLCVADVRGNWGLALKVLDGASRAVGPAVVELLAALELIPDPNSDALRELSSPPVHDTRGRRVGRVVAVVTAPRPERVGGT